MLIFENFRVALQALQANKMRSLLTVLGIIIGSAAVIAVVSIVQGLQHMITQQLQEVGATYVMVLPDFSRQDDQVVRQVKLTWNDGEALAQQVRGIRNITPVVLGGGVLKHRDRQHQATAVLGVNEQWPEVNNYVVERGRFFNRIDMERRRKVAVVGMTVIEELELGPQPVGQEIYLGSMPMTVIGVMEERGQVLGQDSDDFVFIPFDTSLSLFGRHSGDSVQLRMQVVNAEQVEEVKDGIQRVLRQRHGLEAGQSDDFIVVLQDEILQTVNRIIGGVTAGVSAIVGVALLVAGIGIMNIMLVSVTERTREIGLRKSLGARRKDIMLQFLVEAVALALVGGALGLALGYGIGAVVSNMLPGEWPPAHVPLWAAVLAFGFCGLVGVVFGIYPASRAARLDPIEALRFE